MSAHQIIQAALKKGCDAAEVFIRESHGTSVEVKGGKVEALEAAQDMGMAIRVIKGKKQGFSFASSYDDVEETIHSAVEGAHWTGDDEFINIPSSSRYTEVEIFDEKVKYLSEENIIQQALLLEESAMQYDSRIQKVRKAEVSAGSSRTYLMNSEGVNVDYESSYCSAYITALAEGMHGDNQMGWDYAGSRRLSDIDFQSTGKRASQRALELLDSRKISAVKVPVILSPAVAVEFLEILSSSLSAEAVQKQRSFLAGKKGEQIVSPLINIIDDGTTPWGTGTRPVDDEGVAVTQKTVIAEGVLTGYIHNSYTAKKAGLQSTGNASRSSTKSLPGISVSNFFLKGSNGTVNNDLVKGLSRGIKIVSAMGVHTANPISGDFSIGISGLWIEKGEAVYPVKEAVISGNILEMFKKVEAVGQDVEFYGKIGSPSILIGEMDISA